MRSHRLSLLLAAFAAGMVDNPPLITPTPDPDEPGRPHGTLRVACPRCHAAIGENCDARTLGRYLFHKARIDAAKGVA